MLTASRWKFECHRTMQPWVVGVFSTVQNSSLLGDDVVYGQIRLGTRSRGALGVLTSVFRLNMPVENLDLTSSAIVKVYICRLQNDDLGWILVLILTFNQKHLRLIILKVIIDYLLYGAMDRAGRGAKSNCGQDLFNL